MTYMFYTKGVEESPVEQAVKGSPLTKSLLTSVPFCSPFGLAVLFSLHYSQWHVSLFNDHSINSVISLLKLQVIACIARTTSPAYSLASSLPASLSWFLSPHCHRLSLLNATTLFTSLAFFCTVRFPMSTFFESQVTLHPSNARSLAGSCFIFSDHLNILPYCYSSTLSL